MTMYTQTGPDGVAHLVVPAVPLTVSASTSVEVSLPKSQTTTQVNVGGQLVNVTLYYSPNYVYLTAAALLIPPQTSLNLVVTAQPGYPLIKYAAGSASSGQAVTSAVPPSSAPGAQDIVGAQSSGSSSQNSQITAIPPIPASDLGPVGSGHSTSSAPSVNVLVIATLALAAAVAAVVGIAISRAKR